MSLLFMDGFDHYTTISEKGWTAGTIGSVAGMNGNALYWPWSDHRVHLIMSNTGPTRVVGLRRKGRRTDNNQSLVKLWEGATEGTAGHVEQVSARYNLDGSCWLARGGTQIGDAAPAGTITDGVHYIELKATIDDAAGYAELRVDGVTVCTFTGDTRNGGSGVIAGFQVGGGGWFGNDGNLWAIDDVYIDTEDFHGDCVVETLVPSGAGSHTDWTPSAGSNFENVDDATPDDDTTYNSSDTVDGRDSFALSDLATANGSVIGIQQVTRWRKDGAGDRSLAASVRVGATDYDGDPVAQSTSYVTGLRVVEENPATSGAWTIAAVNALEAGYKVEA